MVSEWHPTKNGNLTPMDFKQSAGDIVWWMCKAGHEWQDSINHRNNGRNCPICSAGLSTSYPEQVIFYYIKKEFKDAINRYTENNKEIDIFIPSINIGIEYDGLYYHPNEKREKEKEKDIYYLDKGIKLIRVKECNEKIEKHEISNNIIYYNPAHNYKEIVDVIYVIFYYIYEKRLPKDFDIDIDLERDNTIILNEMFTGFKENSVSTNSNLIKEWNYEKNQTLNPEFITLGSQFKIWWKCDKGHEWQATIASRTQGNGCPYCSNQKVLAGYNDLVTTNPSLASEWHPTKNGSLNPKDFTANSGKKVWWMCEKGHEWQAIIANRNKGTNCPICFQKRTSLKLSLPKREESLAILNPTLALEWHKIKNETLTPFDVKEKSEKKVWWICNKGHEWQAVIRTRALGAGCPYCSNQKVWIGYNDLATTNPLLLEEWDYEKNVTIFPTSVTKGSGKKVWWRCKKCNYEWEASISHRNNGSGCPKCRKKLL